MNKYNLFLDDFRNPIDAYHYTGDPIYTTLTWNVVRNYDQFISTINNIYRKHFILPHIISFDHDLADSHYKIYQNSEKIEYNSMEEKTGYHCAKWLVDFCIDNSLLLPYYFCHSMNPVGRENILSLLFNYSKHEIRISR